jgi:hypothetical protein
MNPLHQLFHKLVNLPVGDEAAARHLLETELPKLPEEVRQEIMGRLYLSAMREENEDVVAIAQLQEKGLDFLDVLRSAQAGPSDH